jgi:catecholate siderophore receptor
MIRRPGRPATHQPCRVLRDPLAASISRILLAASTGVALCHPAAAQNSESVRDSGNSNRLEEVTVTERRGERYRIDESALSKLTESLRDTPQSVSEISRELLDDRGLTSLNDALRTVPGITLGAGEFSWQGNNPSIRGFSARDDMYLDGLRDFGSYPRDPFNLEAVEVLLGPSSVLFGRGSTGGAINQVSKEPTTDRLTDVNLNFGTDNTARATLDYSRPVPLFSDGSAFRINALAHRGEVADRDGARTERFGLAPSLALQLDSASRLTLSYFKQVSDDRPDYGLPWLGSVPAPVPRNNFYGFNSDYLKTDADIGTARFTRSFRDGLGLEALVRDAQYSRQSQITEPLITPTPAPGTPLEDIDVYRYVFIGDSDEDMLTGQISLTLGLDGAHLDHDIVTGMELSSEGSSPVFAFGIGAAGTNLVAPTPSDPFEPTTTDPRIRADTHAKTVGLYAIDTMKLGDFWQVILGARWDRFDTEYVAERFAGPPTPFNDGDVAGKESFDRTDRVLSYRTAFVYKPFERMSVYLAGSTSFNPSGQSLSFLTSGRGLGTGNALLDPERNRSVEIGLKTDLNEGDLSFSSALFEITKTNARIPDPNNPGFNTLGGEQMVRGLSVELSGLVMPRLYLSSAYAHLDGEVVRGAAGAETGAPLANAPRHSVSIWTDYRVTADFDFGAGVRYVSDQFAQNIRGGKAVPSYTLVDAMVRYSVSDTLSVKLNLTNITDEYYFDQLHSWHVVPGPGFTTMLAVDFAY